MDDLGPRLAEARRQRGWTLREAERRTGIPNAHISQLETGTIRRPELATLVPLAAAYGLSPADLAGREWLTAERKRLLARVAEIDAILFSSRALRS